MRRVALLLLACAVVPAVALAARDPHAEKRHYTRADMALAKRLLLRQTDVGPDWARSSLPNTQSTLDCPGFDADFSRFTIAGEAYALYSFRSVGQIVAGAQVYRSRAQAIDDFRLGARPELARCLESEFSRSLRTSGMAVLRSSALSVRAPKVGERAAAYRFDATVSANGARLRVYIDVVAFQRGRAQATLGFTGIGAPVPSQVSYARAVDARMR